jgi:hypothetical protein
VLTELVRPVRRVAPWLDLNRPTEALVSGGMQAADWAHLGTATALWVGLPLLLGGLLLTRRELK